VLVYVIRDRPSIPGVALTSSKGLSIAAGWYLSPLAEAMKLNSTIALTLILLTCMTAIGIVSGATGYSFGRAALKGVKQPSTSPILGGSGGNRSRESSGFLKEAEILSKVQDQTAGVTKAPERQAQPTQEQDKSKPKQGNQPAFPITARDQGVTLAIESVERQSGTLQLAVAMTNEGAERVQFLYTFLDITDEQGRSLTAITKGLPTELLPNGETVNGIIRLPLTSLDKAQKLSLSLTDYPNQVLKLKIDQVPVNP
jgi:hypothetical protein